MVPLFKRTDYAAKAQRSLDLAKRFAPNNDSALVCAKDAQDFLERGFYYLSIERSWSSLRHSVGIFSWAYKEVDSYRHMEGAFNDIKAWLDHMRGLKDC